MASLALPVLFNAPQGKEANMDWTFRRTDNDARR